MGAISKGLILVAFASGFLYAVVDEDNRQAINNKFQIIQDELVTESKPKVDLVLTGDVPPTALVRQAEKSQGFDLPANPENGALRGSLRKSRPRKSRDLGHSHDYYYDYDYYDYDYYDYYDTSSSDHSTPSHSTPSHSSPSHSSSSDYDYYDYYDYYSHSYDYYYDYSHDYYYW